MSLGIFSAVGLGVVSTIPGECWDQPGFKDCHAQMYRTAQVTCSAQGKNTDACIVPLSDQLAKGCKCTKKPVTSSSPTTFSSKPSKSDEVVRAEPMLFGLDMKTLLMVGLGAYAVYVFTTDDKKKKG